MAYTRPVALLRWNKRILTSFLTITKNLVSVCPSANWFLHKFFMILELKYRWCVHQFCHALHESLYFCSTSGVQESNLSFLSPYQSTDERFSPLKPTPEPISGGKSHWPVTATVTELCGLRFALSMKLGTVTSRLDLYGIIYNRALIFNTRLYLHRYASTYSATAHNFGLPH